MQPWHGTLLVLGLGASGEAVVEWALEQVSTGAGMQVAVVDSARSDALDERGRALAERGAQVHLGVTEVPPADLVVASPGVRPDSALMAAVRSTGAPLISEIELAYRISTAPWVAVTGTNGKTTTTALVAHVLREAGFAAEPVGNYGPPAVTAAAETGSAGVLVAEVSSFQLALVERFHPRVAVLLNIAPDHLDEFARFPGVYAEWATNEKVAVDVAIGAAYAGNGAPSGSHYNLNS